MVVAFDFLDVMAWNVSLSGFLLCMGAITLRYKVSSGLVDETTGNLGKGFAIAAEQPDFTCFYQA